jgi:hypothetical protein
MQGKFKKAFFSNTAQVSALVWMSWSFAICVEDNEW